VTDVDLHADQPRIQVRRAIVDGELTGPKSRHGRRSIPISTALAARLRPIAAGRRETDLLFVGAQGATLRPGNLRYRVMIQRLNGRACRGRAFTRCVTRAQRC
jgi:hypothetical protein